LFQIPGTTRAGTKGGSPDEVVERLTRREKQLRKMIDGVRHRERERRKKEERIKTSFFFTEYYSYYNLVVRV